MTTHPLFGDHSLSGIDQLSGNLSFDVSPPQPGGPIGTDPGLWLADDASGGTSLLLGDGVNAPAQGAALQYYLGQQKPSGITLPQTPSGAKSGVTLSLPPVTAPPDTTTPDLTSKGGGAGAAPTAVVAATTAAALPVRSL